MRTEEEIREELELVRNLKKSITNLKYPCTQSAVRFIQLIANEQILEWVLESEATND